MIVPVLMVETIEGSATGTYDAFRMYLHDLCRGGFVRFFVFKFHISLDDLNVLRKEIPVLLFRGRTDNDS